MTARSRDPFSTADAPFADSTMRASRGLLIDGTDRSSPICSRSFSIRSKLGISNVDRTASVVLSMGLDWSSDRRTRHCCSVKPCARRIGRICSITASRARSKLTGRALSCGRTSSAVSDLCCVPVELLVPRRTGLDCDAERRLPSFGTGFTTRDGTIRPSNLRRNLHGAALPDAILRTEYLLCETD